MIGEKEFIRVISAALVSDQFRSLLLTQPHQAIETGFNGEKFDLAPEILRAMVSIQAPTLELFVKEVISQVNGNGHQA